MDPRFATGQFASRTRRERTKGRKQRLFLLAGVVCVEQIEHLLGHTSIFIGGCNKVKIDFFCFILNKGIGYVLLEAMR
jgi:hypothetical protein